MNRTISAPSISLSNSMLFLVLHILPILTGPNNFLSIAFQKCVGCFHHLLSKHKYMMSTKGMTLFVNFCIFPFWCFYLGISSLLVLHWHNMLCWLLLFYQQFLYSIYYGSLSERVKISENLLRSVRKHRSFFWFQEFEIP